MSDITLFGCTDCRKTDFYRQALAEREVEYEFADVHEDEDAARRLVALTGSASKFPTFEIAGRKLRNPVLPELDKALARAGAYDTGLVHDVAGQRFLRYMAPSDAFVSYSWQGDRMVLTHIEVDPALRGSGIGARVAAEVFEHLQDAPHEIRLTCPFLRRVGATRPEWRHKFNLEGQ